MIRVIITAVAALALGSAARPALAPPSTGITPILAAGDLRPHLDLGGTWHYSIDPYRDGASGFHGGEAGVGHRRYDTADVAATIRDNPRALYEYDMDRAPTATLPSSWLTHAPEMRHYQGLVWYQRHFTASPRLGERQFLRFGAVNYRASVWVNGTKVGEHEGGFTTFALEVTGKLKAGDNQITVGVDSLRGPDDLPPPVTDWETYGGITRDVTLVTTPATYVDDAWVRLTADGRIAVDAHIDGAAAARSVTLAIPALKLSLAGRTDANGDWHAVVAAPLALRRWSPDAPTLYDVAITAGEDVWRDRIGFRTLAVRGHRILLNGAPIFLRGISLHEEELGANPTRAMTEDASRKLLGIAKDGLHANYVRLAHYPHSEVTVRMADKLGLLVWSEVPIYWLVDFASPVVLAKAKAMLAEEITRDRNRASIALWSVGNETPVSPARNAFLRALATEARRLDDTRLISAALLVERKQDGASASFTIDDPLVPSLDVMAVNTYNGWYTDDALAAVPAFTWRSPYDKPLIFSEFGADALAGFHDTARTHKFSEEFQADYYRATLAMADRVPFLAGLSPWILKDFRSPRRQHPVFQQGWNRKGLISPTGVRKQAFEILADYYNANEKHSQYKRVAVTSICA